MDIKELILQQQKGENKEKGMMFIEYLGRKHNIDMSIDEFERKKQYYIDYLNIPEHDVDEELIKLYLNRMNILLMLDMKERSSDICC